MTRSSKLLFLFLLILFAGCSTTSDVVGKGPFQKRKYRPGWDLSSLRTTHRAAAPKTRTVHEQLSSIPPRGARTWPEPETAAPLSASLNLVLIPHPRAADGSGAVLNRKPQEPSTDQEQFSIASINHPDPITDGETTVTGDRRWNRMALVSGVFLFLSAVAAVVPGGAGILLYLVTFAFITGIIGLILAIKNKEKGKLLAIAAIAIPLLFIVLLLTVGKNAF